MSLGKVSIVSHTCGAPIIAEDKNCLLQTLALGEFTVDIRIICGSFRAIVCGSFVSTTARIIKKTEPTNCTINEI